MSELSFESLPLELYQKLQKQAAKNKRTIIEETIHLLEIALAAEQAELPTPIQGKFLLTDEWIDKAKREGRE